MGKKEQSLPPTEKEVQRFLEIRYPTAKIDYEPETFMSLDQNTPKGTTPDFRVKRPGKRFPTLFFEATRAEKNGYDPKAKDKGVMRERLPHIPYIVLYRQQLAKMEKMEKFKHLNLNFSLGEIIEPRQKEFKKYFRGL